MHETIINSQIVYYYTPEEAKDEARTNKLINVLYKAFAYFCSQLRIDIPNIAIIEAPIYDEKGSTILRGAHFSVEELDGLDKPLVMISIINEFGHVVENDIIVGTIAHECRHIWQYKYNRNLYMTNKKGMDSAFSKAEIDANAYAIAAISNGKDMNKTGQKFCPIEYYNYPEQYELIMDLATKMAKNITRVYKINTQR